MISRLKIIKKPYEERGLEKAVNRINKHLIVLEEYKQSFIQKYPDRITTFNILKIFEPEKTRQEVSYIRTVQRKTIRLLRKIAQLYPELEE
jgi:hypothetical protein